jgi:hypothetical protein
MKGFKVLLQKPNGVLTSVWAPLQGRVRYRPRHWTQPRKGCGPLVVINDFSRALERCCRAPWNRFDKKGRVVWECEYIPYTAPLPLIVADLPKKLWAGKEYMCFLSPELVLAAKVKILKKVFP